MKAKRRRRPFLYAARLLAILFVVLLVTAIGLFYYVFSIPEPEGLSLASWPHTFTENFSVWIRAEEGRIQVEPIGIERLNEYGLWLQILDENGQEIWAHNKPENTPDTYSLGQLTELAENGQQGSRTIFVSQASLSGRTLNYLVGFPYPIGKTTLYYNGEHMARLSPFVRNAVFLAGCLVVLAAFGCAFWLSRRLSLIAGSLESIADNRYTPLRETGVFTEIYSSLNALNEKIRCSEKVQQETERTRQEWIASITHDLKTPLSPVKGYAELLAGGNLPDLPTAQACGKVMLKNVHHMEKLMNDLKLTYQLEAGALPYAPRKIRIVRFVKELIIDIANDPAFSKRVLEFESELPEQKISADPDLLRRALANIIINALVHNPADTKVCTTLRQTADAQVLIVISDNGNGMDEAELSVLWNRYYRGTSTQERTEGSGLGLAIARQILLLHGGDVSVTSRPGEGSVFTIRLPAGTETT